MKKEIKAPVRKKVAKKVTKKVTEKVATKRLSITLAQANTIKKALGKKSYAFLDKKIAELTTTEA